MTRSLVLFQDCDGWLIFLKSSTTCHFVVLSLCRFVVINNSDDINDGNDHNFNDEDDDDNSDGNVNNNKISNDHVDVDDDDNNDDNDDKDDDDNDDGDGNDNLYDDYSDYDDKEDVIVTNNDINDEGNLDPILKRKFGVNLLCAKIKALSLF